ncbi:MAG TPA: lysylphosphatidylglycerol synthase domain-containing protein [Methylomirabilota bacterium]|nr:lysylphosphatidylglycerol synthase domain-containing protein [Methylomirabilota bacterium]
MSRWFRPLLVLTGLAVVGYLVAEIGPAAIWSSFVTLGWRLAIVLTFPYALAALLDTIAWRLLLPGPVPLSLVFRARLAGEAVNLATPTMAVGGEPLKAFLLRPPVPLLDGLVSVIADKTTIVVGQIIFLAAGLLAARAVLPSTSRLVPIMTGLLAVEILAIGGFALVQASGGLGGGGRLLGRLGGRFGARVGLGGERYLQGLGDLDRALAGLYRHGRRRLLASALVHSVAWATGALEIYLVLHWLGTPASLGTALIIESFAGGVKFASFMVPASLGALEGGYVAFFEAFGLTATAGISFVLVRRLREMLWAGLGFLALGVSHRAHGVPPTDEPAT